MINQQLEQQLAEFVDGTLSPQQRAEVETLLAQDPKLAAEVRAVERLHAMVRSLPEQEPPAEMTDAILQATTRRRRLFLRDKARRWTNVFRPLPAMAASVLVAVVAAFAIFGYMKWTDQPLAPVTMTVAQNEPQPVVDLARAPEKEAAAENVREAFSGLKDETKALRSVAAKAAPPAAPKPAADAPIADRGGAAATGGGSVMPPPAFGKYERNDKSVVADELATGSALLGDEAEESLDADDREQDAPAGPPPPASSQRAAKKSRARSEGIAPSVIRNRWQAYYCGITRPGTIIAADQAQWNVLWARLNANRIPAEPAPTLDFTANVVVGVFMGMHSTGGFGIEILDVRRDGDAVSVIVHERTPQMGQGVTMALTQPYSVVLIPRTLDGLTLTAATPIKVVKQ